VVPEASGTFSRRSTLPTRRSPLLAAASCSLREPLFRVGPLLITSVELALYLALAAGVASP
jgi:hypothetical protein